MKSITRYRFCIAALLFSLLVHAIAIASTAVFLQPGLDTEAALQVRASYVASNAWFWRLGWLTWQITALSDVLLSVGLVAYLAEIARRDRVRTAMLFAVLSLVATIVAVIPDQWAEITLVSSFVQDAREISAQLGAPAEYVTVEAHCLLMVGTCGNAGYTLMGLFWMLSAAYSAGGIKRNWQFVVWGTLVWLLFTAAGFFIWKATASATLEAGYPGFEGAVWCNALAFPLLLIWMVMMAHVLGQGHHGRHPSADAELHRSRWPTDGVMSSLAQIVNSRGVRDLVRASEVVLPVPVLASDITDVIYLNWLVPAERVATLLPPPLQLDCFGDRTFVSLLTYRHGHFGPRLLGPLRRLMPSPCQSNWRLYVEPESDDAARDAIYFFKTCMDHTRMVLASRLMSDGLPSHRPLKLKHDRQGDRYDLLIDPGRGSAPDLRCSVRLHDRCELPARLASHFKNWEQAVNYLVEQNRGVNVFPAHGFIRESRIDIPISVESVRPATLDGTIQSRFLEKIVDGCEPFAFVVPQVGFKALGEGWTTKLSDN